MCWPAKLVNALLTAFSVQSNCKDSCFCVMKGCSCKSSGDAAGLSFSVKVPTLVLLQSTKYKGF